MFSVRNRQDTEWRSVEQRVPVMWPACHLGGRRAWFRCSAYSNGTDLSHRARPWRRDAYAALPQPLIVILSSAMITWSNATSPTPSPLDAFSAVRSWVGCTTNMSGFDLRQAQVAIALLGNRAEAFLSTCGVLPRYQSDQGCKLASGLERFWIGHR